MLHLQDLAKQGPQEQTLLLIERLPPFVVPPCSVHAQFRVECKGDFYLVHLRVRADLKVLCQRCMGEFVATYDNRTLLALCHTEQRATELLQEYECVVAQDGQLRLEDCVTDELHLYAPRFHTAPCATDTGDCN